MTEATPAPIPVSPTIPTPAPQDDIKSLKDQIAALQKEKESWSKPKDSPDPSLSDKVKKQQDDQIKKNFDSKQLESALMFNMGSAEFLKTNESLLPKDVADIFKVAEKEIYGSATEKANACKAAIIQSFFSQQANHEVLTPSQQSILADYLKLTKNSKEEKATEIYDNLFEPTLSAMRRVKKAGELNRSKHGFRNGSTGDSQYKEKLMTLSRKHYLGEKNV
jgi:hypothetical protein